MTKTLPWIRPDVPDDVIIAGALELTWQDLTARVAVVASDRNVRLKARRAGLSTLRPENEVGLLEGPEREGEAAGGVAIGHRHGFQH